jgi:hypothetical protein
LIIEFVKKLCMQRFFHIWGLTILIQFFHKHFKFVFHLHSFNMGLIFSHSRISTYINTIFPQAFQVCVSIFIHLIWVWLTNPYLCMNIYIAKGSCFRKLQQGLVLPSCFHSRIDYVQCSCTYVKLKVLEFKLVANTYTTQAITSLNLFINTLWPLGATLINVKRPKGATIFIDVIGFYYIYTQFIFLYL